MSDEGMDPCECMWSHEMAMRRLLSLLRQSQSYCTDSECFEQLPNVQVGNQTPENSFLLMSLMIAFAIAMYLIRPRALRSSSVTDAKPRPGPDGAPPTPPPTAF